MKIDANKDGNGNIIISEDSFEMLLACLDNQKFIHEFPQNGDSLSLDKEDYNKTQKELQKVIDNYNINCRKILHQKYIFDTKYDELFLFKRYEHQDELTLWNSDDVGLVYKLFENTKREYNESWLIERPLLYSDQYLTISEDGVNNRPWKKEEIEKINELFN